MKPILVYTFALLGILAPLAQASDQEVSRLEGVVVEALNAIYAEGSSELTTKQKQDKVRDVIEASYDLSVIIRRAIGRNWKLMSASEQEQILELVKQLVVKAYVDVMDGKARPVVNFGKVVTISNKRIEIPSTVKLEDQTINLLYRLGKMKSGWQIYDIVVEYISVVGNFRQQIDDHFRKGNGQDLIAKLNELLTKENIDENIQF